MKSLNMYGLVGSLDGEIRNECVIDSTLKTDLYISHAKAEKMQGALMRVHGNREVTDKSIRETMRELRINDVCVHDAMYILIEQLID